MNTLNIALTILCCIIVICNNVIWYKIYRKQQKAFDNYGKSRIKFEQNLSKEAAEKAKSDLRRRIYGIVGDHFHGFGYILEKGNRKYIKLVETLGQYTRGRYWERAQKGFLEYNQSDPDSDYAFPCLNETQNRQMKEFLQEIRLGKREPEDLIALMDLLTADWEFDKAVKRVYHD